MTWLNISRNQSFGGSGDFVKFYFEFNDDMYAVINPSGSSRYQVRKHIGAWASPTDIWEETVTNLPEATTYNITGAAENIEQGRIYLANNANGEVYTSTDLSTWVTLSAAFDEFAGTEANIQRIAYFNNKIYVAHKGGVSSYNEDEDEWELEADFNEGFKGIGQCYDLHVLNNELYVTVVFGDFGAIYKSSADNTSTEWTKVGELPSSAPTPKYLASRDNILYVGCDNLNQNIVSNSQVDTTLTGQPRFTDAIHLSGAPSSLLTYQYDNKVYATCWDVGHTGDISDAYTRNLIEGLQAVDPSAALGDEVWFTSFESVSATNFTTHTFTNGAYKFRKRSAYFQNGQYIDEIKCSLVSNVLELRPNQTYTAVISHNSIVELDGPGGVYSLLQQAIRQGGKKGYAAVATIEVGFTSSDPTKLNQNTPTKRETFSKINSLLGKVKGKTLFEFNTRDLAGIEDVQMQIILTVQIQVWPSTRQQIATQYPTTQFSATASINPPELYRGPTEFADAEFMRNAYVSKYRSNITDENDLTQHSVAAPSPPDEWFAKFYPYSTREVVQGPLQTPAGEGGSTDFDWGDLPEDWGGDETGEDDYTPPVEGDTEEGDGTGNITRLSTKTRRARLLVSNAMKLSSGNTYRVHAIVKRKIASGQGAPLIVSIRSSINEIPGATSTITTTGFREIVWEFSTVGIPQSKLNSVRLQIYAYEEFANDVNSATVYISDVNVLGKIAETPENTVYRFDGEVWDDDITKVSSDGGIIGGHPEGLFQYYESRSAAYRLYCISDGVPYVWSFGPGDLYGAESTPRLAISW